MVLLYTNVQNLHIPKVQNLHIRGWILHMQNLHMQNLHIRNIRPA